MRRALAVAMVLAAGCSVPAVQFVGADASLGPDGPLEADASVDGADAEGTETEPPDGSGGEASTSEGGADAGGDVQYCYGNPPPQGGKCCDGGGVCFGTCNAKSCGACAAPGPCNAPNVCCTSGATGTCQPTCG